MEKFLVKVWPQHHPVPILRHADVHEYLQVYSLWPDKPMLEEFLCAVCGKGKSLTCHVYSQGAQGVDIFRPCHGARYCGSISEDITFPTKEYVVGHTFTLRASGGQPCGGQRLATILRTKEKGFQILCPPHVMADVSERFEEDTYEARCYPGADAAQVVLMILGMDRLVDHTTRDPAK
jgi:hypothetical protein